jgi:hypothetical protein
VTDAGAAPPGSPEAIAADLVQAREAFFAALEALPASLRDAPSLVGEWGIRELIAHLGYWAGHAAESIHAAELGRADEFEVGDMEVEERNATVARVARAASLATVRQREQGSIDALLDRLQRLDPALLGVQLGTWGTLEAGLREDGPVHYREHAEQLRALAGKS